MEALRQLLQGPLGVVVIVVALWALVRGGSFLTRRFPIYNTESSKGIVLFVLYVLAAFVLFAYAYQWVFPWKDFP